MAQIIPECDSVLTAMREHKVPETRENYIYWAFAGDPPDVIDAEVESTFPVQFSLYALDEPEGGLQ